MNLNHWSEQLAYELALLKQGSGESLQGIYERYGYTKSQFQQLCKNSLFQQTVLEYEKRIKEEDILQKIKARILVDQMLEKLGTDLNHPATEYKDVIQALKVAKELAGYHNTEINGPGVQVNILLHTPDQPLAYEVDLNGKRSTTTVEQLPPVEQLSTN